MCIRDRHHDEQRGNIAHDVGHGQGAFPQVFNRQEKDEPDGDLSLIHILTTLSRLAMEGMSICVQKV